MPFAYYTRLTKAQQRVYRQSDGISAVPLPGATGLRPLARALGEALASGSRERTEAAARQLLDGLTTALAVPPVATRVLPVRPARDRGELHGLYTDHGGSRRPLITLWMRTAQRRQVVAFRTFLRTLLHELCHHLDYTLLALPDSFHTEGFYKRESHLFHQLIGAGDLAPGWSRTGEGPPPAGPAAQ
jgi:hypothetical protein